MPAQLITVTTFFGRIGQPNEEPSPSPFEQGFQSASFHDGGETEPCPFDEGTPEHDQWWDGFSWYDDSYYL